MYKTLLATLTAAALFIAPVAVFAQSGGDAGTANKNTGAAAPAPSNQSGTTDSRTTGATAPAPGGSTAQGSPEGAAPANSEMKDDPKK